MSQDSWASILGGSQGRDPVRPHEIASGGVDDWNPVANIATGAFAAAVGADRVFVGTVRDAG